MQTPLVMTVIGKDRVGLVESIARLVADHGGNWLESRMCRLGGEFAGILRIHVPAEKRAALESQLKQLTNLDIVVRSDESAATPEAFQSASLEVVGQDRPGIIREITRALATHGVNVEELATECVSAPMSGEPLFQAHAKLHLPAGITVGALRQSVENAVPGLNVDVTIADGK
jgi:glycine cleavage system regulatory protein